MEKQIISERRKLLTSIQELLEGPMIFLGFVWLLLLISELIWGISKGLEYTGIVIWVIFIFDFLIKLILAPTKLIFLKKNWLTIISLIIPALRVFRIFRFIRLLRSLRGIRLVRVVSSVNRSMKSLAATMRRRAFGYVFLLALVVTFAGAAGMFAIEKPSPGFESYGKALWWTAMRVITAGSEHHPATSEGRALAFIIALFGYAIFGYVTAMLATFFIGIDADEKDTTLASAKNVSELKQEITALTKVIIEMKSKLK
ncbi:ion transporter [Chryseotalea sanaruensis]|uniref:Ion transporter n=1 Tax=Chryseotalea sanaruensis TaxID=2482724 RepID=A0A401UCZ8_9BACT|nr:ion transporter [Chryseotalea sanaruensis]GCC52811.1 ion transporter [Chryseotalea sanaruensis]